MVEPQTGESFFAEFSHLDGVCFEQYLKWFAQKYPQELHIIQLDNGHLHTGLSLEIHDDEAITTYHLQPIESND